MGCALNDPMNKAASQSWRKHWFHYSTFKRALFTVLQERSPSLPSLSEQPSEKKLLTRGASTHHIIRLRLPSSRRAAPVSTAKNRPVPSALVSQTALLRPLLRRFKFFGSRHSLVSFDSSRRRLSPMHLGFWLSQTQCLKRKNSSRRVCQATPPCRLPIVEPLLEFHDAAVAKGRAGRMRQRVSQV